MILPTCQKICKILPKKNYLIFWPSQSLQQMDRIAFTDFIFQSRIDILFYNSKTRLRENLGQSCKDNNELFDKKKVFLMVILG